MPGTPSSGSPASWPTWPPRRATPGGRCAAPGTAPPVGVPVLLDPVAVPAQQEARRGVQTRPKAAWRQSGTCPRVAFAVRLEGVATLPALGRRRGCRPRRARWPSPWSGRWRSGDDPKTMSSRHGARTSWRASSRSTKGERPRCRLPHKEQLRYWDLPPGATSHPQPAATSTSAPPRVQRLRTGDSQH